MPCAAGPSTARARPQPSTASASLPHPLPHPTLKASQHTRACSSTGTDINESYADRHHLHACSALRESSAVTQASTEATRLERFAAQCTTQPSLEAYTHKPPFPRSVLRLCARSCAYEPVLFCLGTLCIRPCVQLIGTGT
eukprot:954686-Rhodomonas_salina.2